MQERHKKKTDDKGEKKKRRRRRIKVQQDKWEAIKKDPKELAGMAVNYSTVAFLIYIYEVFFEEREYGQQCFCWGMRWPENWFPTFAPAPALGFRSNKEKRTIPIENRHRILILLPKFPLKMEIENKS